MLVKQIEQFHDYWNLQICKHNKCYNKRHCADCEITICHQSQLNVSNKWSTLIKLSATSKQLDFIVINMINTSICLLNNKNMLHNQTAGAVLLKLFQQLPRILEKWLANWLHGSHILLGAVFAKVDFVKHTFACCFTSVQLSTNKKGLAMTAIDLLSRIMMSHCHVSVMWPSGVDIHKLARIRQSGLGVSTDQWTEWFKFPAKADPNP